ncbi:uncharacterized protein VP01_6411g1, partial [Puccinia sorghi]
LAIYNQQQSIYRCWRGDDLLIVWMNVDDGVVFTNSNKLQDEVNRGMERDLRIKWESDTHRQALRHLISYLKFTLDDKISICPTNSQLKLYLDAGWGGEFVQSTLGFLVCFGGAVVAWGLRRQKTVALSTCAAEYISMGSGIEFFVFLKRLVESCWKLDLPGVSPTGGIIFSLRTFVHSP